MKGTDSIESAMDASNAVLNIKDEIFDEAEIAGEVLLNADSELLTQGLSSDVFSTASNETNLHMFNGQTSRLEGYDRKSADCGAQGGNGFHCSVCNKSFSNRQFLRTHISHSHSEQLPSERIDSEESDEESRGGFREDSTMFPCDLCPCSFSRIYLLRRHREEVHRILKEVVHRDAPNPKGAYYCDSCNKMFLYASQVKYHLKTHIHEALSSKNNKADHPCKFCYRKFTSSYSCQKHMSKVHRDDDSKQQFDCPVCSRTFSLKDLVHHAQVNHQRIPTLSHSCGTCGTVVKSESRLRWHHWKYHGAGLGGNVDLAQNELNRRCLKCGLEYGTSEFGSHWKTRHWLACGMCNLVFVSSADREAHGATLHGLDLAALSSVPLSTSLQPVDGTEYRVMPFELPAGRRDVLSSPAVLQWSLSEKTVDLLNIKRETDEVMSAVGGDCTASAAAGIYSSSSMALSQAIQQAAAAAAAAVKGGPVHSSPAVTNGGKRSSSLAALAARAKVLGATAERLARSAAIPCQPSSSSSSNTSAEITSADSVAVEDDGVDNHISKKARRTRKNNNVTLTNAMCYSVDNKSSNVITSNRQQIKYEPVDDANSESKGSQNRGDESAVMKMESMCEWDVLNSQVSNDSDTEKYACGVCGQLYEYELYVNMCCMGRSPN